ncbi:MAG: nicotinamide riboside transporter PnuC [Opitutaceae bacterium]|nr:nicotinamide riboside transporter PnuC [Opitutaceae bacterium]
MTEVARTVWDGLAASSRLDLANLLLGITGVVLMIRRSLWAFPVGLLAVSVQGILFWRAKFPADAALQVFFFATLAWGWRHWLRARGDAPELPVTRLGARGWALTLGLAAAATAVWALTVGRWTGAAMPWRDAFIAAFSVAAQVLQARKVIANWPLWVVVNTVAVATYWSAELAFTAFLYAVYLLLALAGWSAWRAAQAADASRKGGA